MADVDGVPFDAAAFTTGILTAMQLGKPPNVTDRAIFHFASEVTNVSPADEEGVPFDPYATPVVVQGNSIVGIDCAITFDDVSGRPTQLGDLQPNRIVLTLLHIQYLLVKGFDRVEIAGDFYEYDFTEPPIGLGSATVWQVHCAAKDDT